MKIIKTLGTRRSISGHMRRWVVIECPYCKKQKEILKQNVKNQKSCGCMTSYFTTLPNIKHGLCPSGKKLRIYQCWVDMRQRCNNKNNPRYHRYGGRGIAICNEWNNFANFHEWSLSNGYKNNLTIERIDNNKGYSPSNCKWITIEENIQNREHRNQYSL